MCLSTISTPILFNPYIASLGLFLVIALRNANKHFWRRCRGRHWKLNLAKHGYVYDFGRNNHCLCRLTCIFSPVVDENRIVYDWFLPAGKLYSKSGGTPKEEQVSYLFFFCHSANKQTSRLRTI